jgi:hypothetical protein
MARRTIHVYWVFSPPIRPEWGGIYVAQSGQREPWVGMRIGILPEEAEWDMPVLFIDSLCSVDRLYRLPPLEDIYLHHR